MIEELKTFIAVVENKNFTRAAEKINMSQPAVSKHIKNLEDYYGIVLIERSYKEKGINITPGGILLYEKGKDIISKLREIKYDIEDFKEEVRGEIKIGASYTIGEFFIPSFLGEISKIYPKISFDIIIENTKNICKKVYERSIDIGLVEGSFNKKDYFYDSFKEDELTLICPRGYVSVGKTFKKEYFDNSVWISREEGSGTREQLEGFLKYYNIKPKKIIVFGSNYSIKEAVKHGLGVSILSRSVLTEAIKLEEVDIFKIDSRFKRKFNYIVPKEDKHSRIINIIIKMLKEKERESIKY